MQNQPQKSNGRPTLFERMRLVLLGAFIIAALLTAVLTFITVRDIVTSWELTSLPGIALREQAPATPVVPGSAPGVLQDAQTPLQPGGGPTPQPWDGASRVTLLMMGLDYRDWAAGEGAPRTDTMILFSMDPIERSASIISIPRDLWVNIPGYEYGRINTAYSLGEAFKYPDNGGPGLAMRTVEELLGVPIDYYAQIDFGAFVRFIDEIGGIKLDITAPITVDPLGDNNTKTLKPGRQTLPGELALAYARARKTEGGDFDRANRQQEVIFAIRRQLLRVNMLPNLISKSPVLYQELSGGVRTNLTLEQTIQLAWLGQQIPEDRIKRGVISPPEQVLLVTSPEGDQVLKPITEKIRLLRDDVFFGVDWTTPAAADMAPVELVKAEAPKIALRNGSATTGLAARTSDFLQGQGIPITEAGNADQLYNNTTIFDYTGKIYTVKYLIELMKISPNQIYSRYDPTSPVDVVVILGEDWARANVLP
jgi:LCP family protein required for cell wall assembly